MNNITQSLETWSVIRIIRQGLLVLTGLLFASLCQAQSCTSDSRPPKQKPVLYEVQDQQLWRHETQTGKRSLVSGVTDVQSVTQSVLNCINQVQRSHEANMVVVSKTDGTVWIRGVIWWYGFEGCVTEGCDDSLGPQRMLDTKGKWMQIVGFKDVVKVAAGETWVVALTRSRQVYVWGTNNGGGFLLSSREDKKNHVPLLKLTPLLLFGFPAYRDIMAFHDAAYGLMIDGQVTAWAKDHICRIEEHSKFLAFNLICPFVYPQQGNVERIWQTPGKPEECNASFVDGQSWQWPCDLTDQRPDLNPPIVPDRIRKTRPPSPGTAMPAPSTSATPTPVQSSK